MRWRLRLSWLMTRLSLTLRWRRHGALWRHGRCRGWLRRLCLSHMLWRSHSLPRAAMFIAICRYGRSLRGHRCRRARFIRDLLVVIVKATPGSTIRSASKKLAVRPWLAHSSLMMASPMTVP